MNLPALYADLSSKVADLEIDIDNRKAREAFRAAREKRIAAALESVCHSHGITLPSDILGDIKQVNGGER